MNTSPDCVSAGLGIDVIEAEEVPNVRDLFEAECWYLDLRPIEGTEAYACRETTMLYVAFKAGYRAAGGQGA